MTPEEATRIFRELDEEERIIRAPDANAHQISIVLDRRKEKARLIDELATLSCPFYARYILHVEVWYHHEEWSELLVQSLEFAATTERIRQVLALTAPRGSGKSAWFSYVVPLWLAHKVFPGRAGGIISEGDLALKLLQFIKEGTEDRSLPGILHTPELVHLKKPGGKGWTSDTIELANRSTIAAKGAKAGLRGRHPHWVILDDLMSQECIHSPTERMRVLENFKSQIIPMVLEHGVIVCVGTPLHTADLFGFAREAPGILFAEFPALTTDESGKERSIWPRRYTVEQLHHIRDNEVGSLAFSREYMVRPVTSLSSLFPDDLFPPCFDKSFALGLSPAAARAMCPNGLFLALDIGISANVRADYTVIMLVGLDEQNRRCLLQLVRAQGLGFRNILRSFIEIGARYGVEAGIVEANQAQAFVADEAAIDAPFRIEKYITGTEKHLLDRGVPMLRMVFEAVRYRIPRGTPHSIHMTNIWMDELKQHTIVDGQVKSTGTHDDTVMTSWFIEHLIRKHSAGSWFGAPKPGEQDEPDREDPWWRLDVEPEEEEPDAPEPTIGVLPVRETFGTTGFLNSYLPEDQRMPVSDELTPERAEELIRQSIWGWRGTSRR